MTFEAGQKLLHYRLIEKIGEGGMGVVYEAEDTRLDRRVAIKILPPELTRDPQRRARFHQEARLAATFSHPNIATVHDVGEQDGVTFIVMELVRGDSLRTLVRGEPIELERVVDLATGVAAGLARAHREGVLHRDLKPDNVVLTDEGAPKILDFGLGKLMGVDDEAPAPMASEMPTVTALSSPQVTQDGQILGTLAYMSPEQVQGRAVDSRSDVFSFGVMLYELLTARQPFVGESSLDTVSSILRDEPAPLEEKRSSVPSELQDIVDRCLAKEPEKRFASGEELYRSLADLQKRLEAPAGGLGAALRRPSVLATVVVVVLLAVAAAAWLAYRGSRITWARHEALPEIDRLYDSGDSDAAMRLLYQAAEIIPDDPRLLEYFSSITIPINFDSDPSGATVYSKGYDHPERDWMRLGETPIENRPIAIPARLRVEKEGYVTWEGAPFHIYLSFRLFTEQEMPPGMVHVPGGPAEFGGSSVDVPDFWIDKLEVSNRDFKQFVEAGGYREESFWPMDTERGSFVDSTGRPGPSGWALGSYPEGEGDLPVGGVSWFEARAYCTWAKKDLPTLFHWRMAANHSIFSEILLWSNFDAGGPVPVGTSEGLGPFGTYDMAGNVREWTFNGTGDLRYILGGAWSEPDYLYRGTDATEPTSRLAINGLRCMKTSEPLAEGLRATIDFQVEDHRGTTAIDDDLYAIVRRDFEYDRRDLDVEIESTEDTQEHWRHEVVSIQTAYGEERLPIHLYLPKNAEPPFQTVLYFPPSSALYLNSSRSPSFPFGHFIPKSGRALVYPIFKGTYERQVERRGPNDDREFTIQITKDLQRAVDYLETRDDIDMDRLAYYGVSWGASEGPLMTAVEPRFATSVLLAGGLTRFPEDWPPGAIPQNFAPRSTVATLMINGKDDFGTPIETNIQPMFDMLGAPDEDKKLVVLDGGHVPTEPNEVIREILDWLDLQLGPVDPSANS
jgi:formylglycine-generating enzyme required for sulfatase activity/tRNA A-37 threonylcarbamoyl transferase component Bud32